MSYGRIHAGFFDSSINDADPETRLVFIAMVVLSDHHGRIDITRASLSRRVNVSPAVVDHAVDVLSSPDAASRTPDHEGRRIVPLDPSRSWGWQVVNKAQYRGGETVDAEEVREQDRVRKQRQRDKERSSSTTTFSPSRINTKDKDTPGVTVTGGHGASRSRHIESQENRDSEAFERLWKLVPRKEGRNDALKHFDAFLSGRCSADPQKTYSGNLDLLVSDLEKAITNYAQQVTTDGTARRYVKQGSTLFYNFRDYIHIEASNGRGAPRPEGLQGVAL
jgi:hypothetical protein